jgi:hypothetical protein
MGFLSWLNDLFGSHEEYGTPSFTLTGQSVRSKAERVIADYFTRHGIPYYYEATATTNDWFIFKSKISRPDFYLPQYNLYVEYWGLVDSPDPRTRDNYIRTMRWKMAQYRQKKHQIHPNILWFLGPRDLRRPWGTLEITSDRESEICECA